MEIPEHAKGYLQGIWYIIGLAVMMWIISKQPDFNCDDYADSFRKNFVCHIVLKDKDNSSNTVTFTGINLENKLPDECIDGSKFIAHHFDEFITGDTIVKNIGEYTINIKRKGKSIKILFECDKVYKDTIIHK